jgi:hypothetical protein
MSKKKNKDCHVGEPLPKDAVAVSYDVSIPNLADLGVFSYVCDGLLKSKDRQEVFNAFMSSVEKTAFERAVKNSALLKPHKERALREEWHKQNGMKQMIQAFERRYPMTSPITIVDYRHVIALINELEGMLRFEPACWQETLAKIILAYQTVDPKIDMSWTEKGCAA